MKGPFLTAINANPMRKYPNLKFLFFLGISLLQTVRILSTLLFSLYRDRYSRVYDQMPSSVLEGEHFIPRCKNGVPLRLLLAPLRLVIYPLPSVSLENPTQIVYKDPRTGKEKE